MLQSVATVVFGVLVLRLVALLLFAWGQFRQSRRQRGHMRRSGVLQESGAKGGDLGGSPAAGGRSARADLGLEPRVAPSAVWPGVTVLVPAYNEEAVIGWTLHHLLCSDYPAFEVLVVDDGSQDGTVARVQELCARWPQLRLLQQPRNQGKAEALNAGIAHATFDLIVTVDADTRLAPDALRAFVGALQEDDVSAVTGVLLVGNLHNPLLVCQEVEYTAGIHVERRAQSFLSCITTLPGAASAFRKQALRDVGGFCADTMAEDSDLTLTLLATGIVWPSRTVPSPGQKRPRRLLTFVANAFAGSTVASNAPGNTDAPGRKRHLRACGGLASPTFSSQPCRSSSFCRSI